MRLLSAGLIFYVATGVFGQSPEVPHKLSFAGMTLTIRDDARREIQEDVNALTRNPHYFELKVDRARQYFPIIERIFREERVPDDFKYLVLQESALIADAVSVSNAVGFWQFKDFTAREVGLRVDEVVDERKNIVSATRGAARYLKQNNFVFNNWILALQAYQMGAGGVKRALGNEFDGERHMHITPATYWYVKKYLAHLVAFAGALQVPKPVPTLREVVLVQGAQDLASLAQELEIDPEHLATYNKWILAAAVPADRPYTVIFPEPVPDTPVVAAAPALAPAAGAERNPAPVPQVAESAAPVRVHGKAGIAARPGERLPQLVARSGLGFSDFLDFNDIEIDHEPKSGMIYFVEKKNSQGPDAQHLLASGEDLWTVAQQYAVQLKRLRKYNRLKPQESLDAGAIVWLNTTKPKASRDQEESEAVELENDHWITLPEGQVARAGDDTSPAVHVVQKSDTLYSIARRYGVTVQQLMDWNDKKDVSLLLGEQLKIGER